MLRNLPIISGIVFCFCVTAVITSVITPRDGIRNVMDNLINRETIQNMISRATLDDGVVDPHLLFRDKIQDPLPIPDFNISTSGTFSEIDGQFRNISLHGLRQLRIRRVHINAAQMNITVETIVSIIRLEGLYNLDGTVSVIPVTGEGDFWMNASDIVAMGSASILRTPNGNVEVDQVDFNVEVGDTALHFENLMGGDSMSALSNAVLNEMTELMFSQTKASMLDGLEDAIKKEMNARLMVIPSGFFNSSNSSTIFDNLLEKAGTELQISGMDPMHLPDIRESTFKKTIAIMNIRGKLRLVNGTLSGLSSLHRTGDITLTYENNSVTLEASMGFGNISGGYGWKAAVMGIGPSAGKVSISVGSMAAYVSIRQELRTGSRPQILELRVERIGYIWLDVDGLGALDFLLEMFINTISNTLKDVIANFAVVPVRIAIQRELDNSPDFLF